jgi:16S rRNA (guanine527-N7)-methyltransferase
VSRFAQALAARSAALRIEFPARLVPQAEQYLSLLARWNRTINLTALPVEELGAEALDRLILEPVAAAPVFPARPCSWIDLGSGGGSPAIPLKLLRPEADLVMVESRTRKVAFLREVIRELGLAGARAEALRFDVLAGSERWLASADVVTARAVKIDEGFVATVAQVLRPGGRLLVFDTVAAARIESGCLRFGEAHPLLPGQPSQLSVYNLTT